MGLFSLFKRYRSFSHGGIYPVEHKELTAGLPIRRVPFAPQLVIPLSQHKGAPAKPLVAPGQEVVRGEPIAAAGGFVSVPMHAPATGRVKGIELWPTADGPKAPAIVLDVYEAATQEVLYDSPVDVLSLTPEQIIQAVQDAGLVGLGGATFPSHVKLKPPKGRTIHTVLINGCECEPYLTCDHRVMLERTDALLLGVRIVLRATGAKRAIIGVEDNKLDAVSVIRARLPEDLPITAEAVQTKYPQGAEKMLIESLLGAQVPEGGLPADVGVAVYNVGTVAQMGELLPRGRGLIERVVTVSGPGVERPGNYLVPLGTPVQFLLDYVGIGAEANEVILGGPMMGTTVASMEVPVTKGVSGIVVYQRGDPDQKKRFVFPCIKCARCVEACPMQLNPSLLGQLAQARDYERMEREYHLNLCFECGCCAYVCPSNIPLTQYFRIAKSINRERPKES
ncbi:MAG: electron transport complex subunit RsxC [Pseudomonadota bacterium]|jgi:electron transport complex protein RnfC